MTGGECPVTGQPEHKELNIWHSLHYDHASDLCFSRGKGTDSILQYSAVQCGAEGGAQTFAINGFASIKLEKNHSPFFNNPIIVIVLVKCQTNFNLGIWSN